MLETCDLGYLYLEVPSKKANTLDPDCHENYSFDKHLFHTFPSDDEIFAVVLPEPQGKFSSSFYIPKNNYENLLA